MNPKLLLQVVMLGVVMEQRHCDALDRVARLPQSEVDDNCPARMAEMPLIRHDRMELLSHMQAGRFIVLESFRDEFSRGDARLTEIEAELFRTDRQIPDDAVTSARIQTYLRSFLEHHTELPTSDPLVQPVSVA